MARFVLNLDILEGRPLKVGQQVNRGDELRVKVGGRERRYLALDSFHLEELSGQDGINALVRGSHLEEVDG